MKIKSIDEFDSGTFPKTEGATLGFIKTISQGLHREHYMFKPIPLIEGEDEEKNVSRGQSLVEYAFGGVFKTILGEQAPDIGLAHNEVSNELFLTSKYLENFSHVDAFIKSHSTNVLSTVQGIEKVVITSLLCGDHDLNAGNLGVITKVGVSGTEKYLLAKLAKIDHGASGTINSDEDFASGIQRHYSERDYAKFLPLDPGKTREAIQEVLAACPPSGNITTAIGELAGYGVDPKFTDVITYNTQDINDFEQYLAIRKNKLIEYEAELAKLEASDHLDPVSKKSSILVELDAAAGSFHQTGNLSVAGSHEEEKFFDERGIVPSAASLPITSLDSEKKDIDNTATSSIGSFAPHQLHSTSIEASHETANTQAKQMRRSLVNSEPSRVAASFTGLYAQKKKGKDATCCVLL